MIDQIINEDITKIKDRIKGYQFSEKKVIITGAAGFIGSWICDLLISLGANLIAVDDLSTGRMKNIDHLSNQPNFDFEKCNVSKFQNKEKIDVILHLAGHASPEEYQIHPIETLKTSAIGTINIAELARKNDAKLLFASTSEVYGDAEVIPTPESYWGKVNPIGPRSSYDEGKRFAEALLIAYHKQYGLDVKIPRIFNTYGPRLRQDGIYGRAMSRFVMQALADEPITIYGDGKQTRSFCYITDTITGLILLINSDTSKGEVTNVGNTQEITILDLAEKIKAITKCKSPLIFQPLPKDDPRRRCPDTNKITRQTGWKSEISLDDGLSRTIDWFLQKNHDN